MITDSLIPNKADVLHHHIVIIIDGGEVARIFAPRIGDMPVRVLIVDADTMLYAPLKAVKSTYTDDISSGIEDRKINAYERMKSYLTDVLNRLIDMP